ncbi:hypothetical protein [Cryobacterium breve]|nr:hypothetical protein [Cryobacterium breve]
MLGSTDDVGVAVVGGSVPEHAVITTSRHGRSTAPKIRAVLRP